MRPGLTTALVQLGLIAMALSGAYKTWWRKQQSLPACEMTYVYSKFERLATPKLQNADGYKLQRFVHPEQENQVWNKKFDPSKPVVDTTPVLFIPGHAGTHFQGRSMASECGRKIDKFPEGMLKVGLDWYHLDTREQLSAFDGSALERQTEFVLKAMRLLKGRYNITASSHQGIVLVGHSMGGLVARMAIARAAQEPGLGPHIASLLITEATPHQRPALPVQPSLHHFYDRLAQLEMPPVPIISLSGGYNDTQVGEALTSLHGLVPPSQYIHTSLEEVPGVWASAEHVAIVWCNQLVSRLSSMLIRAATVSKYVTFNESELDPGAPGHLRPEGYDGAESTLQLAKDYFEGSVWRQMGLEQLGEQSPAAGGKVALEAALDSAKGTVCKGSNLAWYRQYESARTAKGSVLQMRREQLERRMKKTGLMYYWPLNTSGQGFMMLTSACKPCTGFRLWVNYNDAAAAVRTAALKEAAEAAGAEAKKRAEADGANVENSDDNLKDREEKDKNAPPSDQAVEVTHLTAILPLLRPEARRVVRVWGDADKVMKGIDYNLSASWAVHLPPHLLEGAAGVTLWLGVPSNKHAFQLTAHLYKANQTVRAVRGIHTVPSVLEEYLPEPSPAVAHRQYLGPVFTKLKLDLLPISWDEGLRWLAQKAAGVLASLMLGGEDAATEAVMSDRLYNGVRAGLAGSGIWEVLSLSVEAKPSTQEKEDKKVTNNTCFDPMISLQEAEGYDGAGVREYTSANLSSFSLAPCQASTKVGARCTAVAALDPACKYRISIKYDPSNKWLSRMVQSHLSGVWSMAQVLLMGSIVVLRHSLVSTKVAHSAASSPATQSLLGCLGVTWNVGSWSSCLGMLNATIALIVMLVLSASQGTDDLGVASMGAAITEWATSAMGDGPIVEALRTVTAQLSAASTPTLWLAALPLMSPTASSGMLMGFVETVLATAAAGALLILAGSPPGVGTSGPAAYTPLNAILITPGISFILILALNITVHLLSTILSFVTWPVRALGGRKSKEAKKDTSSQAPKNNGTGAGAAASTAYADAGAAKECEPKQGSTVLMVLTLLVVAGSTVVHIALGAVLACVPLTLACTSSRPKADVSTASATLASTRIWAFQRLWLMLMLLETALLGPSLAAWVVHSMQSGRWAMADTTDVALLLPPVLWSVCLAFKPLRAMSQSKGGDRLSVALRVACKALVCAMAMNAAAAGYFVQAAVSAVGLLMFLVGST